MKLQIMDRMRLLPTDERVLRMSSIQWLVMSRILYENELMDFEKYALMLRKIFGSLLGVEFGEDKIVPLSAFIDGGLFKEILDKFGGVGEGDAGVDEELVSESMDKEAEDVFRTDIESMLTEEELKKIEEVGKRQIERLEDLAGVIKKDGYQFTDYES